MRNTGRLAGLVLGILIGGGGLAFAQLPPGVFMGEADVKAAPAGTYVLDPSHTSVIAKVSHIGYALSVFRFGGVEGSLTWDPAQPETSKLTVKVKTASIETPVAGFAKELAGSKYLNAAAHPDATFVSTAFHRKDDAHGTVDGTLTLLGKSAPVTFDVELGGAGKGFMGHPRLGISATGRINPQDFGMNAMFSTPIRLEIDAEFATTGK